MPSSRGSSFRPRDRTQISCIAGRFYIVWATRDAHTFPGEILPVDQSWQLWGSCWPRGNAWVGCLGLSPLGLTSWLLLQLMEMPWSVRTGTSESHAKRNFSCSPLGNPDGFHPHVSVPPASLQKEMEISRWAGSRWAVGGSKQPVDTQSDNKQMCLSSVMDTGTSTSPPDYRYNPPI